MRRRTLGLIARKELLDTLRDRRTLFVALVLPLLLYPALLLGLTQVVGATQRNLDAERQRVLVDGVEPDHPIVEALRERRLDPVASERGRAERLRALAEAAEEDESARGELRRALEAEGLAGAVLFEERFAERLVRNERGTARLLFDPTREASKTAHEKAREVLAEQARAARERYVAAHPEEEERLRFMEAPVSVRALEVASREQKGAYSFAPILGMLIVLMALTGAFYPAVDLVAGEKERGTMETLLVSPLTRAEIVLGKFAAVWLVAVVTALLNLLVMGVTFGKLASNLGPGVLVFSLPFDALVGVTAILVPTAALFGAVALALASFAGSYKEGQHYLSPLFLVASPLAMVGLLPGIDIGYPLAVVPVANVVLLVKAMLLGGGGDRLGPALVATLATALYAAVALRVAVRLFEREDVLFRAGAGKGLDARALEARRAGLPSEAQAAFLFFAVVALMFYFASSVPDSLGGIVRAFLATQLLAVLAPTLVFARLARLDFRATFALRPLAPSRAAVSILAGFATLLVVAVAQVHLFPAREPQGFEEMVGRLQRAPWWLGLALLAILPPLCEEALCRGFLLSAFRTRRGELRAVLLSAALFGALHLDLYRFPATAAAGVVAGLLLVRTGSLLAPILFHAAYNGTIAASLRSQTLAAALAGLADPGVALPAAALAGACLLAALRLLRPVRV
jgi:sodium transport system permease protein